MSIKINTQYISEKNSYAGQTPEYIVIHNTDNYNAGADAKAHASAQYNGNFSGYSAHVYVDDKTAYQALAYNRGAWHVGVNYGGNMFGTVNNRNSVGIEMCVNSGYDYEKAFANTVDVCKQIMNTLKISADHVVMHYDVCAKNCPSAIRTNGDWSRFKSLISNEDVKPKHLYRVRKTWKNAKSQLGAYEILENAKNNCPSGYHVYDESGKKVWSPAKKGTQATELTDMNSEQFIKKLGPLFTADQKKSGVLASVSMAQCILESGWGESELSRKANNMFGMKKNLSGNTWAGSAWDGKSVISMKTGEEDKNGQSYTITAEFRAYPDVEHSIADHSAYLTGAKNGKNLRYKGLKDEKDYNKAVQIIKDGGYATGSGYAASLCRLIEQYNLTDYDVKNNTKPKPDAKPQPEKQTPFRVKVDSDALRIRKGPATTYKMVGYTGRGIFTIVETDGDWGKLKSGAGWICINMSCVHKLLV